MAITVTTSVDGINACNARVSLANTAGVLQDISGHSNSVNLEFTQSISKYKTFYNPVTRDWMRCSICGRDGSGTISFVYEEGNASGLALIRNWFLDYPQETRNFQVDVPRGAGGDRYDMVLAIESFPLPLDAQTSDPIFVEIAVQICGRVAHSTIVS